MDVGRKLGAFCVEFTDWVSRMSASNEISEEIIFDCEAYMYLLSECHVLYRKKNQKIEDLE